MGEVFGSYGDWFFPTSVIYPNTQSLSYFFVMAGIEWKEVDWLIKE